MEAQEVMVNPHDVIRQEAPRLAVLTAMEKVVKEERKRVYEEVKAAADEAYEIDGSTARDINLAGTKVGRLTCSIKDSYNVTDGEAFDTWLRESGRTVETYTIRLDLMTPERAEQLIKLVTDAGYCGLHESKPKTDYDAGFTVQGDVVVDGFGEIVPGVEPAQKRSYRFTAQKPEVVARALRASGEDMSVSGLLTE
jgi:hypothetical protein